MCLRGILLALVVLFSATGCATLFGGGSSQDISIEASQSRAEYAIVSSSGIQVAEGSIPSTVSLPRRNDYQVAISLDGYETRTLALTRGTNGWIWVNLLTGAVGFIVDFITGAAYSLQPAFISVTLEEVAGVFGTGHDTFAVVKWLDKDRDLIRENRLRMEPMQQAQR